MWFDNKKANWLCLHCNREFEGGRRGGMFDHVNTINIEEIRQIIIACDLMNVEIVAILDHFTLWNLLMDLSKKPIALKIIKKWDREN